MRPMISLSVASLLVIASLASGCAAVPVAASDDPGVQAPVTEELPAGALTGFLVAVTTDPATVTIDTAEWVADDTEPNGYRIDNPDPAQLELALADDARIRILTSTGDPATAATVDVDGLQDWFAGLGSPDEALFDIIRGEDEVVELRFLYRP